MMFSKFFLIAMICILPQTWDLGQTQNIAQNAPIRSPVKPPGCESVGFSAKRAAGADAQYHINAVTRISFQDTLSDFGSDAKWDKTKFCSSCPGFYFFSFHALSSEHGDFTLSLQLNEQSQVTAFGSKNGNQWAGNSAILSLGNDDCVRLELEQGTIYEHPAPVTRNGKQELYTTTFSGFLTTSA
ncbi:unnamed protein product [Meganyctiphanes norvegica]|uniref:C1q domain-containing protein n=1 Tax=Meganyctiphanes norvegica TaxID=48144 RepID=A0AAV2SKU8_MEGNR